jgi:hypothetical protein
MVLGTAMLAAISVGFFVNALKEQATRSFVSRRAALQELLESEGMPQPRIAATIAYRDLEERQLAVEDFKGTVSLSASLMMLFATIVLVWATWRYVGLTYELVENNKRQLHHILEREQAARRQGARTLNQVCHRLRAALTELPHGSNDQMDRKMRQAAIWSERDYHDMELLATEIGQPVGVQLGQLLNDLRWIEGRIDWVRNTPEAIGVRWGSFPWQDWLTRLTTAEEQLRLLEDEADRRASA